MRLLVIECYVGTVVAVVAVVAVAAVVVVVVIARNDRIGWWMRARVLISSLTYEYIHTATTDCWMLNAWDARLD